jgi:hypothetical protein
LKYFSQLAISQSCLSLFFLAMANGSTALLTFSLSEGGQSILYGALLLCKSAPSWGDLYSQWIKNAMHHPTSIRQPLGLKYFKLTT